MRDSGTILTPIDTPIAPEPAPAEDIRNACVELAAHFADRLDADDWDVLRRVIATLRGVAAEIGGLVRPEEAVGPAPNRAQAEAAWDYMFRMRSHIPA